VLGDLLKEGCILFDLIRMGREVGVNFVTNTHCNDFSIGQCRPGPIKPLLESLDTFT